MAVFLNKKINNIEKIQYENNVKIYSGFLNDFFTQKSISINSDTNSITFNSITCNPNNGFIVAVADNYVNNGFNFIFSSDGGQTWTNGLKLSKIKSIIYANNKYVGIGYENSATLLITSSTPSPISSGNWTNVNSVTYAAWTSITYGNGYYVAVADSGTYRIITSKNTTNWETVSVPLRSWKHINYSSDLKRFIALADSYVMYSNYNGKDWTESSTISGAWCSATWSPKLKLFIAVANSGTYRMMKSSDGISWSSITLITNLSLTSIIWSQELNIFIATSTEGTIITSPDGDNWTYRIGNVSNQKQIIWNSYFGNFIIISSNNNANKAAITPVLGINSLLIPQKYYYYELDDFYYTTVDSLISIGNFFSSNNNLNENLKYSFTISPSLPTGLNIDQISGEIYGTPLSVLNRAKFEVTATNNFKTLKNYIYLTISGGNVSLTSISYVSGDTAILSVNSPINLFPTIKGSFPITYSISPSLPNSLTFDTNTGRILGITPGIWSSTQYTITATNILNSITNNLTITINDIPPISFTYNNGNNATHFVNTSILHLPSENSGTNIIYSIISPTSPTLTINSTTGQLSGTTPSTPQSLTYVIKASNSNGNQFTTTNFTINVVDTLINNFYYVNTTGTDEIIAYNNSIVNVTPVKNGGSNVQWGINTSLVSGYSFSQSDGRIYGASFSQNNVANTDYYFRKSYQVTAYNNNNSINKNIILSNNFSATFELWGYNPSSSNFTPLATGTGLGDYQNTGVQSNSDFNLYKITSVAVLKATSSIPEVLRIQIITRDNSLMSVRNTDLRQYTISFVVGSTTYFYPFSSANSFQYYSNSINASIFFYKTSFTLPWAYDSGFIPMQMNNGIYYHPNNFSVGVRVIAPLT